MPIRVYKLAKELGVTSKDIMSEALNHGIEVQNHMGSFSEAEANMIRAFLYKPPEEQPEPEPAEPVATAAVAEEEAPESGAEDSPDPGADETVEAPAAEVSVEDVESTGETAETPADETTGSDPAEATAPDQEEETGTDDDDPDDGGTSVIRPSWEEKTVVPSPVNPVADQPATARDNPERRGATILGHKELPTKQPTKQPAPPPPSSQTPVISNDGMVQTSKVGSKRTFVRAPSRGGPGRRGPGGGRGFGGRPGGGQHQHRPKSKVQIPVERPTEIEIQLPISIKDLSSAMALKAGEIIAMLMKDHEMFPSINTTLEKDIIELIGIEFDCDITVQEAEDLEQSFVEFEVEAHVDDDANLDPRPPIITFLGHVDHGKTSLLDRIREARVAEREHGGITQHIGAYRASVPTGDVVFLDTPGHQAFTEMRARGANITDVVVVVIAADDGVMPQTEEAIAHARAAETPIIIALNKCDKPEANPERVKQQLSGMGLQPEDWGGETVVVEVSAVTGQGIDSLVEYLALVSELLDLKANPERLAEGVVVESLQKKGEGNVARIITTNGTLRRGDNYLCGQVFGKVKAIRIPTGKIVTEVGPAWPIEIPGLSELPQAGDKFHVVKDAARAKDLAEQRRRQIRENKLAATSHVSLEGLLEQGKIGQLNIIVKVDTAGSLEVIRKSILELKHDEIEPKIIHAAIGSITETDVALADASDAVILGFHVTDSAPSRKLAEEKGIEIRLYHIIYKLLEELKEGLEGRLAPEEKENILGHIEVRKIFKVSRIGTIAGCKIQDGLIRRKSRVRIMRGGLLIHEGRLESLKHNKDDVKEMKEGYECGLKIAGFDDIKVDDIIEPYEIEKIKRTLGG